MASSTTARVAGRETGKSSLLRRGNNPAACTQLKYRPTPMTAPATCLFSLGAQSTETATMVRGSPRKQKAGRTNGRARVAYRHTTRAEVGTRTNRADRGRRPVLANSDEPRTIPREVPWTGHRTRMTGHRRSCQITDQLDDIVGKCSAPRSERRAAAPSLFSGQCRSTSEPKIDASRVECLKGAELFATTRRCVIGKHDSAGPDPDRGSGGGRWRSARGERSLRLPHPWCSATQRRL